MTGPSLGVGLGVDVASCVGIGVGVVVDVGVAVGLGVGTAVGVEVCSGVGVAVAVGTRVAVGTGVSVAVGIGVEVRSGVGVADAVATGVLVGTSAGVRVGMADAVAVAVAVGNTATDVTVGAGAHAANNMLKHTTLTLPESRGFIFSDPIHLKKTSLPLKRGSSLRQTRVVAVLAVELDRLDDLGEVRMVMLALTSGAIEPAMQVMPLAQPVLGPLG
jgi:hypothetical protein